MFISPLTAQQELDLLPARLAYVESLTADNAPSFLIDAHPDGPDESITLVFVNQENLDRVKAVLLAELQRSGATLEAQVATGQPTPFNA